MKMITYLKVEMAACQTETLRRCFRQLNVVGSRHSPSNTVHLSFQLLILNLNHQRLKIVTMALSTYSSNRANVSTLAALIREKLLKHIDMRLLPAYSRISHPLPYMSAHKNVSWYHRWLEQFVPWSLLQWIARTMSLLRFSAVPKIQPKPSWSMVENEMKQPLLKVIADGFQVAWVDLIFAPWRLLLIEAICKPFKLLRYSMSQRQESTVSTSIRSELCS